ncbi:transposase [Saccharicrinis aurantiacus]|uniref:transposase n=1 Tax=Saccharicrinis aurantiacus TaxID=1849719 RepID=UPI002490DC3D|nr:transposase [Saccharicrinis aurantiacus]
MEREDFDFKNFEKEAIKKLQVGEPLEGADGVLAPLLKRLFNASLEGELDAHLKTGKEKNRKNGKGSKKLKTSFGEVEIDKPRGRNSTFSGLFNFISSAPSY